MSHRAERVSISALLGSPHTPLRRSSLGSDGGELAKPDNLETLAVPPLSIGNPACTTVTRPITAAPTPAPVIYSKPHPVRQLQGAVTRGRRGKKHTCMFPGCGREFTRRSNLEAHSRKHMTGERATPYACIHCGRRFKWRSSLKSHEGGCMHQLPMVQQAHQQQQRLQLQKQQQAFKELQQGHSQQHLKSQHSLGPHHLGTPPLPAHQMQSSPLLAAVSVATAAETAVPIEKQLPAQPIGSRPVVQTNFAEVRYPLHHGENMALPVVPPRMPRPESYGMLSSLQLPPPGTFPGPTRPP